MTRPALFALALLVAPLLTSEARGETPAPDAGPTIRCATSPECPCGMVCDGTRCRGTTLPVATPGQTCSSEEDCRYRCTGLVCVAGSCQREDSGPSNDLGVDATSDTPVASFDIRVVPDVVAEDRPPSPPDDTVRIPGEPPSDVGYLDRQPVTDRGNVAVLDTGPVMEDADAAVAPDLPDERGCSTSPHRTRSPWPHLALFAVVAVSLRRRSRSG